MNSVRGGEAVTFTCRQCGSCCMYLGDYIVINRQTGPFEFSCECVSTGTEFTATIDKDKREIFSDRSFSERNPRACPFLRPDGSLLRCTIHTDSPVPCKFYRCIVMQVTDNEGHVLGRVTGTLNLHSDDRMLRAVWEEAERCIPDSSPDAEDLRRQFLIGHGFCVL